MLAAGAVFMLIPVVALISINTIPLLLGIMAILLIISAFRELK